MIWCPKCHYQCMQRKFSTGRCPQCRTLIGNGEELHNNPFLSVEKKRNLKSDTKKLHFHKSYEKEEGSGDLKSRPISELYDIKGRI